MKKYEILKDDYIEVGYSTVYRIKALKDFSDVKKGDLGGYIEKEGNLSQDGDCWVYENAKVYGSASVYDRAEIYGNAEVYGYAKVCGNAKVYGNAEVCGNAEVYDNAEVYGYAEVYGNAKVYGNAIVYGNAKVFGNASVYDRAEIYGNANAYGNAIVYGNASVCDEAKVYGNAEISFYIFSNKMRINTTFDNIRFFDFINARSVTALLVDGKWLFNVGCQNLIDKDTFLDRIYNTDGGLVDNPHRQQYLDILEIF